MIIAVDFDGTCVKHAFPEIGEDIGAAPILRLLVHRGHKLILFTMRSDVDAPKSDDPSIIAEPGDYLSAAVKWFEDNNIHLWGVNCNPEQHTWTGSPKPYAHIYIDDAALGVPLINKPGERPYVDWVMVHYMLHNAKIL